VSLLEFQRTAQLARQGAVEGAKFSILDISTMYFDKTTCRSTQ
jgi:hypothetical protein